MSKLDIEVRSYRSVFALERRIYRLDAIRLNPGGVPLRGIAYAVAFAAASYAASGLPVVGWLASPLPWYVRDLAVPVGLGAAFAAIRIEGRVFHVASASLLRYAFEPRLRRCLHTARRPIEIWRPSTIAFIADGSEGSPRAMRYRGPGVVLIRYPHHRVEWRRSTIPPRPVRVSIHPLGHASAGTSAAIELERGAVLDVSRRHLGRRSP